jgi:hypothetical protein
MRTWLKFQIFLKFGTQSKFAKSCGRNDNWISRIVTEKQNPTKEEKRMIALKLGEHDVDRLFHTAEND